MNWRSYLILLRPVQALFGLSAILFVLVGLRISAISLTDFDHNAFAWWVFILPLTFGFIFTEAVRAPLRRPFAMTVPDLPRRLARWHATIIGFLVLLCTAIAYAYDRALPLVAIAGIVGALFTLLLPVSFGWSTAGSALVGAGLIGIFSVAIYFPSALRHWILSHPWISGVGAWALVCFNFARGFARNRCRASAASPPGHTLLDPPLRQASTLKGEPPWYAARIKNPGKWTATPSDGSLMAWLQVISYERGGASLTDRLPKLLMLCGLIAGVAFLIELIIPKHYAHSFYATVWGFKRPEPIILLILLINAGNYLGLLRPEAHYPVARTMQARVAYTDSMISILFILSMLSGVFLLATWLIALRYGWPTPLPRLFRYVMLVAWIAPFIPLVQWGGLHQRIRNDHAMTALCGIIALIPAIIVNAVLQLQKLTGFLLSPGGIALCLLLIGASQYAFYAALRRFYRKGDLLQRGTKRQNLSLV